MKKQRIIMRPRYWIFLLWILGETTRVLGGNCWISVNKNGRCTALVKAESSREECCDNGSLAGIATTAWSEEDLTPSSLFYMHLQGGVPCTRCKDSCDGVKCQDNQKCVVRNGVPKCVCAPDCTLFKIENGIKGHGPVCGSDGKTYKTPCRLLKRACRRRFSSLSVSYEGPCRMTCSNLHCPGKKQCLLDQNMIPHCVNCITRHQCSNSTSPAKAVCGVDGVTYPSICQLRQNACQRGKAIPVAYKGPCKKRANCNTIKCSEGQSCLVEISTGKPRCVTCSQPKWCQQGPEGALKGPICSTNGKTYKNWCDMVDDGCKGGIALDTRHFGKCKGTSSIYANNSTVIIY